ncbi:sulfatase [Singulisphaera acidiphila]|uniref:sulfatase n=1 Tax=Singulisphaera acidiphila TaxID=466153 RepID=UPI001ED97462|nr:sulfatase-like hydrolase/transferase [Singulisphaera acidiphila]
MNLTQEIGNRSGEIGSPRHVDPHLAESGSEVQPRPRLLIASALIFGLVAGFLELALVLAQDALIPKITMDSLRTNLHFIWMIPLANVAIFGTGGLMFGWLARSRPALANKLAFLTMTTMLALALLMRFDGLYMIARIVLSMGIATCIGPRLQARALGYPRLTCWSLGLLGGGLIVLIAVDFTRVATAESRALGNLPKAAPKAPNVLFLVMDNVRAASASLNGHDRPTTPNLDRLAARGVRFEEARSTASWTLPSHAGMFTGQWHHRLSVGWDQALDRTYPTLAEYLSKQGYATAGFVGNIYYCNRRYGLDRGFARYEDYYENQTVSPFETIRSSSLGRCLLPLIGYPVRVGFAEMYRRKNADMLNQDLLGWLSKQRDHRPFFAFVNYYDAHAPCVLPEGTHRRFGHAERPRKEQTEALKRYQKLNAHTLKPEDGDPKQIDREGIEILRDSYESCIAYIDAQIGRLFADLERQGMLENTMVVVTSDHGEHFDEHGFVGHGQSVYRREVHVPLLIIPPSNSSRSLLAKGVVPEPVSLRDLPATIVDLLAIKDKAPFPGSSLAPLWSTNESLAPDQAPSPVLSEVGHKTHVPRMERIPATLGEVKALISEGKVYIRNSGANEEVFDLNMDPLEKSDIVAAKNLNPSLDQFRSTLKQILAGKDVAPE